MLMLKFETQIKTNQDFRYFRLSLGKLEKKVTCTVEKLFLFC